MQSVSSWNRTRPVLGSCGGILHPALYVTASTERALFTPNAAEPERSEITDELRSKVFSTPVFPFFFLFFFPPLPSSHRDSPKKTPSDLRLGRGSARFCSVLLGSHPRSTNPEFLKSETKKFLVLPERLDEAPSDRRSHGRAERAGGRAGGREGRRPCYLTCEFKARVRVVCVSACARASVGEWRYGLAVVRLGLFT